MKKKAVKLTSYEFALTLGDESTQLVTVEEPDEAEARSRMAELYPGLAFVLNEPDGE